MQLQLIYGAYGAVHGADIASQGMLARTDNPDSISQLPLAEAYQPPKLTAAPPAIVPSKQLLISITFLTVWLAIQSPAVALESVATMMPS